MLKIHFQPLIITCVAFGDTYAGLRSGGNAWERRTLSFFRRGNAVPFPIVLNGNERSPIFKVLVLKLK